MDFEALGRKPKYKTGKLFSFWPGHSSSTRSLSLIASWETSWLRRGQPASPFWKSSLASTSSYDVISMRWNTASTALTILIMYTRTARALSSIIYNGYLTRGGSVRHFLVLFSLADIAQPHNCIMHKSGHVSNMWSRDGLKGAFCRNCDFCVPCSTLLPFCRTMKRLGYNTTYLNTCLPQNFTIFNGSGAENHSHNTSQMVCEAVSTKWNDQEKTIIRQVCAFSASLSVLGCIFIIIPYILYSDLYKKFGFRLILTLSIAGIF